VEIATRRATFQNQCSKLVAARDKVVNMAAGDSDDALACCVENTVEDRIMDSGASFHATYYKEELDRFRLCSGKVRLANDKILDIAGLKRRLILVGQLDEEGYYVGFRDQQCSVAPETWWFGEAKESFLPNVTKDKETAEQELRWIVMMKIVPETPLQFGVAERLS
ncbi:hypothetical protein Tco_0101546, partial [Tanacetum coccineum]